MKFDNRYIPYLRHAGLASVANIVRRGMPPFIAAAITALVDRWQSETHMFYLPCGEMTPTLEDVAMLLALPIRGQPVTRRCSSDGWRDRVREFLGVDPPTTEGRKARVFGVHLR